MQRGADRPREPRVEAALPTATTSKVASRDRILVLTALFPVAFIVTALVLERPAELAAGLGRILTSPDTLTTDYMGLGSVGSALLNAGLLTLVGIVIVAVTRAPVTGATVAALFLLLGFGMFGKNLLNIPAIVTGVWLYARFRREPFARHVNTAFFGAALAPIFSELLFSAWLPWAEGLALALGTSLLLGFVLPPTAAHLFHTHQGYSLYNVGFVAGVLGAVVVAVYQSWNFVPEPVFVWSDGHNLLLGLLFAAMYLVMIGLGVWTDRDCVAGMKAIMRRSGQSPTDFLHIAGMGATMVNMGLLGLIGLAYVLAVGSDLNGATLGAVLTIVGFGACGKHPSNTIWIMLGVLLASLVTDLGPGDPVAVMAALLGTTLAPVAGAFGWYWGIVAGFVHASVVQSVEQLHGGLVLYNNGFAAGLVAAVLVPVIVVLRSPRPSSDAGSTLV